jgi:DNA repair exonuclease SbcCD nuclease subunit
MNILIFTDLHIKDRDKKEIERVTEEIITLSNETGATEVWSLGDTFDVVNPSPTELDLFASFLKKLNKKMVILSAMSHESISPENSVLNHFGVILPSIKIVPNSYIYEYSKSTKFLLGHYTLKESSKGFGADMSVKELEKYKYVFLGHQHSYQNIKNVYHLGSVRYIRFDEVNDQKKYVGLLEISEMEKTFKLIPLKTPYPMLDVVYQNEESLSKIKADTKVRVIINTFEDFKAFSAISNKYKEKFIDFRIKTNFTTIKTEVKEEQKIQAKDFTSSLKEYLVKSGIDKEIVSAILEEV